MVCYKAACFRPITSPGYFGPHFHFLFIPLLRMMWSRKVGSNHRRAGFESAALPLSYSGLSLLLSIKNKGICYAYPLKVNYSSAGAFVLVRLFGALFVSPASNITFTM